MIVPGIGKIVEGINSVNSAIDSNRAEKIIFLESDKTASHRLELLIENCLLYTSPSPRDRTRSRMPSSA